MAGSEEPAIHLHRAPWGATAPRSGLQGVAAPLPGPDPDDILNRDDPDLAITDLAGAGGIDDGGGHFFYLGIVNDDFQPDLWYEFDLVLSTPVDLGVASLAPEALGLGQGQSLDTEGLERLFDVIELERLHYRYD